MGASGPITTCVLLLRDDHYLNQLATSYCSSKLHLLAVAASRAVDEDALAAVNPDLVLSFLNKRILERFRLRQTQLSLYAEGRADSSGSMKLENALKGALLAIPGVNFHPAPPEYPGRGGASLALFDGQETYGATAHILLRQIDAGPILAVRRFDINPTDTCDTVYARAEIAALELFFEVVDRIAVDRRLPSPSKEMWLRNPITRKEFQDWLVLDPSDKNTFIRKVKAAAHPRFPGPYVDLHG
jgi:methionyl-tRNA formyltransferase